MIGAHVISHRISGRMVHARVIVQPGVFTPELVNVVMGRRWRIPGASWRAVQITVEGPGPTGWEQLRFRGVDLKPNWLDRVVAQLVEAWKAAQ